MLSNPSSSDATSAAGPVTPTLFPLPLHEIQSPVVPLASVIASPPYDTKRGIRLREAQRSQISWGRIDLGATLADDHTARAIWAVVERLNLSALYAEIEARNDVAGTTRSTQRSCWRFGYMPPATVKAAPAKSIG